MKTLTTSQLIEVSGGEYYPGKFVEMGISTGLATGGILAFVGMSRAILLDSTMLNVNSIMKGVSSCMAGGLIMGLAMGMYQESQIEEIGRENARMVEYV